MKPNNKKQNINHKFTGWSRCYINGRIISMCPFLCMNPIQMETHLV